MVAPDIFLSDCFIFPFSLRSLRALRLNLFPFLPMFEKHALMSVSEEGRYLFEEAMVSDP
jgi:hypothetical protein